MIKRILLGMAGAILTLCGGTLMLSGFELWFLYHYHGNDVLEPEINPGFWGVVSPTVIGLVLAIFGVLILRLSLRSRSDCAAASPDRLSLR
jgi:hypothetical protein